MFYVCSIEIKTNNMETKYTKGEWVIRPTNALNDKGKPLFYDITIDDTLFISTHKNIFLGIDDEEQLANAKLIASAPKILEALQEAKSTIARLRRSIEVHPDCEDGSEFADYVDLAYEKEDEIDLLIKKATE